MTPTEQIMHDLPWNVTPLAAPSFTETDLKDDPHGTVTPSAVTRRWGLGDRALPTLECNTVGGAVLH